MTALGIALLLAGAALVIAEAHVPGGVLGVVGGIALMFGGIVLIAGLGGGVALAIPVGVGIGVVAAGGALYIARQGKAAGRARVKSGAEGLLGHVGVVKSWAEPGGQVFVDGALWRARNEWPEAQDGALRAGDKVVVERVSGLTLCVRRADEWEVLA